MIANDVVWTPSPESVANANLTSYQNWLAAERGVPTSSYADLLHWSVTDLGGFWASIIDFCGLTFTTSGAAVLTERRMPGASWFPGTTLNYAENIFRAGTSAGRDWGAPAIHHASEVRPVSVWTWGQLRSEVTRIAAGLRAAGVSSGDRVAAYMPNIPETIAGFLACASIGAIWSSAAPEFGARTVLDRWAQIRPKVVLAVDGYRYGGRDFDRSETVEQIISQLPDAPALIRFGYLDGTGWDPALIGPHAKDSELTFTPVPFEHPLWIVYSSGTTGLPKAIVHSQGGMLVEQAKMGFLHLDAKSGDRVFWFTTTGWMMWNFLIGVLLTDADIVLYDGLPKPDVLWQLAADARISTFGTSAAFISGCIKAGTDPHADRDLSALRAIGSTGSPLSAAGFQWIFDNVSSDIWLFSASGGTDVCTAFVGGVPTLPVRLGEIQAPALGAAIEAFDESGQSVTGEMGELVLTQPMPSMPVFFWNDPDPITGEAIGPRYRESYFSMFPGVWRHGDWIEINEGGGLVIHGRSDATINRGGVRIGTGEIYATVLELDDIVDALVVDLPRPDTDGSIEMFVVLRAGAELDDDMRANIRRRLRENCSPRHLPDRIVQIDEVPRTRSGKVTEVPVKRILMGVPADRAASREALSNPAALDVFIEMAAK